MDTIKEEWNKTIDTNLKGAFLFTKEVLPNMIENKFGSVIVNVSSGTGKYGFANLSSQCANKFGIIGLTESVAKEVNDFNIRVMAICSSGIDTNMIEDIVNQRFDKSIMNLMKPEEIAKKIYDMIFNQKSYYNGYQQSFIINIIIEYLLDNYIALLK